MIFQMGSKKVKKNRQESNVRDVRGPPGHNTSCTLYWLLLGGTMAIFETKFKKKHYKLFILIKKCSLKLTCILSN